MLANLSDPKVKAIVAGGAVAGALDIAWALANTWLRGGSPVTTLEVIAGGLIGRAAMGAGTWSAALGLLLHIVLTTIMAAVFVVARDRLRLLSWSPFLTGPAYGVLIYLAMHRVVLPLSNFVGRHPTELNVTGLLVHMLLVGLPIALAAKVLAGARMGHGRRGMNRRDSGRSGRRSPAPDRAPTM